MLTNTKGGTTKTTSAVFLACALAEQGSVRLLDADPQGSVTEWAIRAEEAENELPLVVEAVNLAQLRRSNAPGADFTLIDTPPGDPRLIDAALAAADVAVIPTAPSSIDMARTWETEQAARAKVPAFVLVAQADMRTRALGSALRVLDEHGVGRFETVIPMREAIRQSFGTRPGPDLHGYETAANELVEAIT